MVLTPQMAISHLVMTIGVGISQKKNIKKFDLVTILWFDPYICTYRGKSECCLFFSFHYSPLSELHSPSERCNPLPIFSVVSLSVVSLCSAKLSVSSHQHCQPSLR